MYELEYTNSFEKDLKRCKKEVITCNFFRKLLIFFKKKENYLPNIVPTNSAANSSVYGSAISKATGF